MFSDDVKNRVRNSIDIVDLISGYVSLKKAGKNHLGLCPFHSEKTPSFNVNPERQIFHCFGCGVGGDVFTFLEMQEGLSFPEALKQLAQRAGIPLPADSRSFRENKRPDEERKALLAIVAEAAHFFRGELEGPAGATARSYLAKRGVSSTVIRDFLIGFARPEWDGLLRHLKQKGHPFSLMEKAGLIVKRSEGEGYYDRFRGRIIFPIRNITGDVIAFGGRVLDDSLPKYLNSPETPLYSKSSVLYGLDRAKDAARKQAYFIVVEGYLDAIACHQYGVLNAVATLGTALTEGHLRLMRRFAQKLVLIFDPDPAGVKAALRGVDLFVASGMKVNVVSLPGGDDPDTFLGTKGHDAFAEQLRQSRKFMDFVLAQVAGGMQDASIDSKVEKAGEMLGYIAKLPSGIERDHYLKLTAEALDLDEAVLRQEMPKQAPGARQPGSAAQQPDAARGQRPKAEEILLHLMLKDGTMARDLLDQIQPQDFTDPLLRKAVERVAAVIQAGKELTAAELMTDDAEANNLISHFAVLEMNYDDPRRSGQDCVDVIRQRGPEKKIRSLVKAIQEAEAQGDTARLAQLIEEQNVLTRRPGRRIPGLGG